MQVYPECVHFIAEEKTRSRGSGHTSFCWKTGYKTVDRSYEFDVTSEFYAGQIRYSHPTITCEVIAGPHELFDSRPVVARNCLRRYSQRRITCLTIQFIQLRRRPRIRSPRSNRCRRRLVLYPTSPELLQIHPNSSSPSLAFSSRSTAAASLSRRFRSSC